MRGEARFATRILTLVAIGAVLAAGARAALARGGDRDWFTRVKQEGLVRACAVEVARYEKGVLRPSLHVGRCYYDLGRFAKGVAVMRKLLRSPDRNYAAAALAGVGEGLYRLGRTDEAKKTFRRCLSRYPEAWLDGSVPDRCRAWLRKIAGKLRSPDVRKKGAASLKKVREQVRRLKKRLDELKRLIEELGR